MIHLHPHQQRGIDGARQARASGKRRIVVAAPTGAGKTVMAAMMILLALAKGLRVVFVVHRLQLIDQTVERLRAAGIAEIGVIQANHWMTDWSKPVQVASVQTLQKCKVLPKANLVIIDEVHCWFESYARWMAGSAWASATFIGLSATPWTKGLGKHFEGLIEAGSIQELIDSGHLAGFRVFAPSHPDLKGVRTVAGDYHEGELSQAMQRPKLVADAVDAWLKHGEGRQTLCFGVDRAHAQMVRDKFASAGIAVAYIDGTTPMVEREVIRRQFHAGDVQVVCSVGCLTTGVDWDIRCISLCRPTKSEMLFVQMIGRGLRTAPGKDYCLILDHSDSTLRLGFVTDIHHDVLDDGRGRRAVKRKDDDEVAVPKECLSCGALKRPGARKCWSCGFEPKLISKTKHADGSLVEFTGSARGETDMGTKQLWFSMLIQVANDRGYSPHWVSHKYREKFGVWPRGLHSQPVPPNAQVLGFVRSRLIAHAKRQASEKVAA